jgi:hypothetical protein
LRHERARCCLAADRRRRRRRRPRPTPPAALPAIDPDDAGEPVELPDGRTIYVPRLHGQRVDELACGLLDLERPARSRFVRLTGPLGTGKSQLARAIALELGRRRASR